MFDVGEYTIDDAFGKCPEKICTTFNTIASKLNLGDKYRLVISISILLLYTKHALYAQTEIHKKCIQYQFLISVLNLLFFKFS